MASVRHSSSFAGALGIDFRYHFIMWAGNADTWELLCYSITLSFFLVLG